MGTYLALPLRFSAPHILRKTISIAVTPQKMFLRLFKTITIFLVLHFSFLLSLRNSCITNLNAIHTHFNSFNFQHSTCLILWVSLSVAEPLPCDLETSRDINAVHLYDWELLHIFSPSSLTRNPRLPNPCDRFNTPVDTCCIPLVLTYNMSVLPYQFLLLSVSSPSVIVIQYRAHLFACTQGLCRAHIFPLSQLHIKWSSDHFQ